MALIICNQCGKKISDTTDKCIHCGCTVSPEKADDTFDVESAEQQENEKEPIKEFSKLEEYEKEALEKEFLASDKWARKYKRDSEEASKFGSPLFVCFFIVFYFLRITVESGRFNFGDNSRHKGLETLSLVLIISLFALLILMFIYSIAIRIYFAIMHSKYIYMKKFQRWLMENKNIEYHPAFTKLKQKRIFDKIRIK